VAVDLRQVEGCEGSESLPSEILSGEAGQYERGEALEIQFPLMTGMTATVPQGSQSSA
jgi:hypothetical protein